MYKENFSKVVFTAKLGYFVATKNENVSRYSVSKKDTLIELISLINGKFRTKI